MAFAPARRGVRIDDKADIIDLDPLSEALEMAMGIAAELVEIKDDPSKKDLVEYLKGKFAGLLKSNHRVASAFVKSKMTTEASAAVEAKLREVRQCQRLVVVFLVDCTGSMQRYIDEVKNKIKALTDAYQECYGQDMFFGFCGYRDHGITEPFKYDIDGNVEGFKGWLNTVRAHSEKQSGWTTRHLDEPEDVAGGLRMAARGMMGRAWPRHHKGARPHCRRPMSRT